MTWEEAIKFCEEHECEECPAFIEDKRTDYQKKVLHYHCCWNLVDEEKRMKVSEDLHHWKREAELRHKTGQIVPSWLYEKIHRLEKMIKQEKTETGEEE